MEVRIIDKVGKIIEIKSGQKRRGWIRLKIENIGNNIGCPLCCFSKICNHRHQDIMCAKIVSEILSRNLDIVIPPHFYICRRKS